MSLRLAARRLALPATAPSSPSCSSSLLPSTTLSNNASVPTTQRRQKWAVNMFKGWGNKNKQNASQSQKDDKALSELDDPKKRQEYLEREMMTTVEDNIFQDELEASKRHGGLTTSATLEGADTRDIESTALVVDPDPRSRVRWERKQVIKMVRTNGHISREDRIKMTERELLHKSAFLPTSVKKLVMLSRQIAGKPLDEAITQMKWSKKKMAAEIRYYLEEARDLAVASRGMGLGQLNGEILAKPRKIQTKDGKWLEVTDPTRMYIAQSWVGRGAWRGKEIDYKGRGRMGIIQHPSTSFTVLLKEEKTRMREHDEREAKKAEKAPWVHLPNRPVYGQRPYYTW